MGFQVTHDQAPQALWKLFSDITDIPRPSKKEEKIRAWIINLAKEKNLEYREDAIGNIAITLPAKTGKENSPKLVIQNHIDMVTDAIPGKAINFETDPIEAYVDGDWVKAKGTTLGADNGIGCAAGLALIFDDSINHPEIDLLFTVDEETGLTGALKLDPKLVSGDIILNLDTEEWGSLYVGCAGGADFDFKRSFNVKEANGICYQLSVKAFAGGHSGVDIHRYRANAAKYLIELLNQVDGIQLASFESGKAHNIIPRDASAKFYTNGDISKIASRIDQVSDHWKTFLSKEDLKFEVVLEESNEDPKTLNDQDSKLLMHFLNFFPHGVNSLVRDAEGSEPLVGTSNNMAVTILKDGEFYLLTSMRFFNRKEAVNLEERFCLLGDFCGMTTTKNSEYPSWNPNFNSDLLTKAKTVYKELFGSEAEVKAIHAGLECGILMDRLENDVQALSFGPTITNAHSPDEGVHIPSVTHFWNYYKTLLESL